MGILLGLVSLGAIGLTLLTKVDDILDESKKAEDSITHTSLNVAGLMLIAIGGMLVWKEINR